MVKCMRKFFEDRTIWKDKTAPKHKHNYKIHHILEVKYPNRPCYYNVLKCDSCYGFKTISEEHNINGCILKPLTEEQKKLPFIHAKKHNYYMDIGGYDEIVFPDGKTFGKKGNNA